MCISLGFIHNERKKKLKVSLDLRTRCCCCPNHSYCFPLSGYLPDRLGIQRKKRSADFLFPLLGGQLDTAACASLTIAFQICSEKENTGIPQRYCRFSSTTP
jgi:hypothetical protein